MRISDWSSDVCSSDLRGYGLAAADSAQRGERIGADDGLSVEHAAAQREALDKTFVLGAHRLQRSEERGGGEEGVGTCRSRWSPYHETLDMKDKPSTCKS